MSILVVADRVRDTSTTTGTGPVTVSGVPPVSYRTFSAVCAVADTLPYFIQHQSADEFEVGIGTYSASNQLTRTLVLSSSNANAAVSFSAGTKDVVLGIPARNAYSREVLQDNRDYFIRQDGSDSNTGLADTAGGAWLTFGHAWAVISNTLDFNGKAVTIGLGSGTWTASCNFNQPWVGGGSIYFYGTGVATTIIHTTSDHAVQVSGIGMPGAIYVDLLKMTTTTGGSCICLNGGSGLIQIGAVEFGASAEQHMNIHGGGIGQIYTVDIYVVSGNANNHAITENFGGSILLYSEPTGAATFSNAFANSGSGYIESFGLTFGGITVTGRRYAASANGVIQTFASGANYFPGSIAGITATGGQYA